ncbi:hypothetical protein SB49_13420 [Sediminicola sp. YIK13]|uniref:hypothetical protein n=1 Tax=Sediminicola sp. YIK13 TaxID=1453352 RepID=UPI0007220557|nr:hypothetical protein [Sediminicola sp. YIK13]ALM08698.1 hypothetical protein SB49_13420 [Sediminicola sp. YIK13]
MAQNKHPMRIAMSSVFLGIPDKAFKYSTEVLGFETVFDNTKGNFINLNEIEYADRYQPEITNAQ